MLNSITIMGRLVRTPELRTTQTGIPVTSFTLAVDRDFKSRESGEKSTDFIDVVAWKQTAEFVCKYFTKGRMAVMSGRLQIREWKDRDGNNRRNAEVVADSVYFGDSRRDNAQDRDSGYGQNTYGGGPSDSYGGGPSGGYGGAPAYGGTPAGSYAGAPGYGGGAPAGDYGAAPAGGYDAPNRNGGHEFIDIDDQDGSLPF